MTGQGLPESEANPDNDHYLDIININPNIEDFLIPCEETGCDI